MLQTIKHCFMFICVNVKQTHVQHNAYTDACICHLLLLSNNSWYRYRYSVSKSVVSVNCCIGLTLTLTNLVIEAFLTGSFLCQLVAIRISFTKEVLAAKWRSVDRVSFVITAVCLLHDVVNLALNSGTLILSKQQPLKSYLPSLYTSVW